MKTRAIILAGGEGARLSILTAKRAKPAVPFAGKYRIIDFVLSNCVNSRIFDVMLLAQYRPQSLIEHIGAGGPWDLNRDFTGGVRIFTPYKARFGTDWFVGTADAVQQNFTFVKEGNPQYVVILSGDHIYTMNYEALIAFHIEHQADLTMATFRVTTEEASRFGIVGVDGDHRVTSFVEKPKDPPSDLANMGVYVFNLDVLGRALWEDRARHDSAHDFGRDILPLLIREGKRVFAYPYNGYWKDVGTMDTYWQSHMDLLVEEPLLDLNDRSWLIHTRTESRPPAWLSMGSQIGDTLLSHGCVIERGARVEHSVLSPGVIIRSGTLIRNSILLNDTVVERNCVIHNAVLDKEVQVCENSSVGEPGDGSKPVLALVGKKSILPEGTILHSGGLIGTDVIASDYESKIIESGESVISQRKPYDI